MKKLIILVFVLLAASLANSDEVVVNGVLEGGGSLTVVTVATIPAAPTNGQAVVVTDGSDAADCSVGSGSNVHVCLYNGSAWVPVPVTDVSGNLELVGSLTATTLTTAATALPGITAYDSDGAVPTRAIGKQYWDLTNTGDGTEVSDIIAQYITAGSLAAAWWWDGSASAFFLPTAGSTLAVGTTDIDGTPPVGKLIVKGTTADGTTYPFVLRDSAEANIFTIDTDGNMITYGRYRASTTAVTCADATDTCAYTSTAQQHWITAGTDATGDTMTVTAGVAGQTVTFTLVGGTDDVTIDVSTGSDSTLTGGSSDSVTYRFNANNSTWYVISGVGL